MIFRVRTVPSVASELPLTFSDRQMESLQSRRTDIRVFSTEHVLRMRQTRVNVAGDVGIEWVVIGKLEVKDVVRERNALS